MTKAIVHNQVLYGFETPAVLERERNHALPCFHGNTKRSTVPTAGETAASFRIVLALSPSVQHFYLTHSEQNFSSVRTVYINSLAVQAQQTRPDQRLVRYLSTFVSRVRPGCINDNHRSIIPRASQIKKRSGQTSTTRTAHVHNPVDYAINCDECASWAYSSSAPLSG